MSLGRGWPCGAVINAAARYFWIIEKKTLHYADNWTQCLVLTLTDMCKYCSNKVYIADICVLAVWSVCCCYVYCVQLSCSERAISPGELYSASRIRVELIIFWKTHCYGLSNIGESIAIETLHVAFVVMDFGKYLQLCIQIMIPPVDWDLSCVFKTELHE